jgi:hypothetical protein
VIYRDIDPLEQELQEKVSEIEKAVRKLNTPILQKLRSCRHGGKAQQDDLKGIVANVL